MSKKLLPFLQQRKKVSVFIFFLFFSSFSFSQQKIIVNGNVIRENDVPLAGVSISVKGSTVGTTTDAKGRFTIEIVKGATLIFSSVGYENRELKVDREENALTVQITSKSSSLDEVVVVSFGTQKKRDLTGAVSSVRASDLIDMPMAQIGEKLQGKLPGVRIYQTSGVPGSGMSIRIRGQASVSAGNSPLVVIDGFPSNLGLEDVNPYEIEDISVLKDASASALYGSRAANGVILITTKQADNGKTKISLNLYSGIQKVPQRGRPDVMNASQFSEFKNQWYSDQGLAVPERYKVPAQYEPGDGTDWFAILLNPKASTQNYNLSISSGTSKVRSFINASYNKQEGVMLNTFAERASARANNIFNVSKKLTFALNMEGVYRNSNLNDFTPQYWSLLSSAYIMDPTLNYKNADGSLPVGFSSPGMFPNPNWYNVLTERKNPQQNTNLVLNSYGEYKILDGLSYKLSADINMVNSKSRYWSPSTAQGAMFSAPPNPPVGNYSMSNSVNWQIENLLNYNKTFGGKHNLEVLLGYSAQKYSIEGSSINGTLFPNDNIPWVSAAASRIGNVTVSQYSLLSTLGRLNYNYESKYSISLSARQDGSSRFGNQNRFGFFPSIAAAWTTSKEHFMKKYENAISFLKFRVSYGKVGNYNIGNYSSLSTINKADYIFDNSLVSGQAVSNLGNPSLTWETTTQGNIGLDLGLFNNRIFLTYDYYWKTTDGLLYATDIPAASGFSSIQANIGRFDFWGHEIGLETKNFIGKFKWNTNLTFGLDRNIVKKLGTNNTPIGGYQENVDFNRTEVGHPIGQFYGYVWDGIFMNAAELAKGPYIKAYGGSDVGSVRMKDISGPDGKPDGFIDPKYDKTFIGNPNPDFVFGITNEFSYRNFDLSINLLGRVGGDVFKGDMLSIENIDGVFNVTPLALHRWRSLENPGDGQLPRSNSNPLHRFNNSRQIFDGSYLSGKNITLGYNVPLKSRNAVKAIKVYVSSQNAFIITRYPGPNPDASQYGLNGLSEGRDFAPYPIPTSYTLGCDINF